MHVHLIGIGGIGLSAIARVLVGWGYSVSGSDHQPSTLTQNLRSEGITVYDRHVGEQVAGADLVVVSSAIPPDNSEVLEAECRGIPVVNREEFLGDLTRGKATIAVAGTHGKTTTSAMISWILTEAGFEPTFIVGGVLQNLSTNARAGKGDHFVIEADEYERAFLGLTPDIAVVTALEHDHPDCYPTFEEMRAAFAQFVERIVPSGLLVVWAGDREELSLGTVGSAWHHRTQLYGLDEQSDWWAQGVELGNSAAFTVLHRGRALGPCALQVPGRHNVLNALAALAASTEVGVDFGVAAAALTRFRGIERRFEVKGQVAGITVVDDYAHHPTEIRATLAAARLKYPGRPIWAVFQPHTYTRTVALLRDFVLAFEAADRVLITDIYAAREVDDLGISGKDLIERMAHPDARFAPSLEDATAALLAGIQRGDVVITMGAGDGYLVGDWLLERLEERQAEVQA
jgi:UDP-N-acetylmuramate--alanine ligase